MPYFFLMMFGVLIPGGNVGVSTLLGSDAINLLLVIGLIQYSNDETVRMDLWVFIKDAFFYIVALILLCVFYSFESFKWYQAFTWLMYFLVYTFYFQKHNEHLKEKVYRLLGIISDDDAFSSEEYLSWKPRRESITELVSKGYVKQDEGALKKKLNRQEMALKIELNGIFSKIILILLCLLIKLE